MRRIVMVCGSLILLAVGAVGGEPERYKPDVPKGAQKYESAKYTQSISVLFNGRDNDVIDPFPVAKMSDKRWHQPGGLEGVTGWTSERYRYVPEAKRVRTWIGNIGVRNSLGYVQQNRGLLREYPDGTRFDEVLINTKTGIVFEHRVRQKLNGKWLSTVEHKDADARPKGYGGLKVACNSCHREAGTGKYNEGLVPGGDTVLGDPLPWELWRRDSPEKK